MAKHADPALVIFDKLEGHIADLSAKFVEIGEKYGPDVINLGLDIVRLVGAAHIFSGLAALIITCVSIRLGLRWIRKANSDQEVEVATVHGVGAIICGFAAAISLMIIPFQLLNFWNYVAIFYPVAYLAKRVLEL